MKLQVRNLTDAERQLIVHAVEDYEVVFRWRNNLGKSARDKRYARRHAFRRLREEILAGYDLDNALYTLGEEWQQFMERLEA